MMTTLTSPGPALASLVLAMPLLYGIAALFGGRGRAPWRGVRMAAHVNALVAFGVLIAGLVVRPRAVVELGPHHLADVLAISLDTVSLGMLALVNVVGLVIVRFSGPYLDGDPGLGRYARWLAGTLAAVNLLVGADHLLVLSAGWVAASLCLHQLLLHFAERSEAQLAAHKKFLASRTADVALLAAVGLIYAELGTLRIDAVSAWAAEAPALTPTLHGAALLVVLCAALKSAQLPFHGWLTQVMEAPTPVSALLHAGVVNIAGFVLIRLEPLMGLAAPAQATLVAVGTVTATVAALVMSAQVTIKGRLAWSTMAQMGFMLLQCGLGAYAMAFLHLIAHSLYKAHAFLTSGSAVEHWQGGQIASHPGPGPSVGGWWLAGGLGVGAVLGLAAVATPALLGQPSMVALLFVVGLAIAPLFTHLDASGATTRRLTWGAAVVGIYLGLHELLDLVVLGAAANPGEFGRAGAVIVSFTAAFALQSTLLGQPAGGVARALHPYLLGGFYLDELFTRLTFRIWPPRPTAPRDTWSPAR